VLSLTYSRVKGEGRKHLEVAFKQKALHGKVGKVGWVKPNVYPKTGMQVAHVAVIQEFGYAPKNIPPRSFMRTTIAEQQISWKNIAYRVSQEVVAGKRTGYSAMEKIGAKAAGDIRRKISTITYPPLKPATIARRRARYSDKSTIGLLEKPLVDTKRMIRTLTHSVEDA
jgi:hypothetical protein